MLIVEIALGIVLAVLILAFLPSLLSLAIWLVALAFVGVVALLAYAYPQFGVPLGLGLLVWVAHICKDRVESDFNKLPGSATSTSPENCANTLPYPIATGIQGKTKSKYGLFFICLFLGLLIATLFALVATFIASTMIIGESASLIIFTTTFIIVLPLSAWLLYRTWPLR